MTAESNGLSRRKLLVAGAAGLAGAGLILPGRASAAEPVEPDAAGAVGPMAMITRNYLGSTGCHLAYEPSGDTTSFTFETGFYNQLAAWKEYINDNTPATWGWASTIYSYGAYTNKPGMHGLGRAFDLGRIIYRNSDGQTQLLSMRYDVWRNYSNADWYKKRYWGTAASLMRRFRHVLTYMDNTTHWNHARRPSTSLVSPSMPRLLISSNRSTRRPVNFSITRTFRVVYSWCGTGERMCLWPSSRMISLNLSRFAASLRKSSSSASVLVKSSMMPTGLARSAPFLNFATSFAMNRMIFMSAVQRAMMPGRWTLITTNVPSRSFAE